MKNKKVILIIISGLFLITLLTLIIVIIFGSIKEKEIEEFYQEIEKTTCKYAEEQNINQYICNAYNNLCRVKYETLISWGYIDEDLENPKTHKKVSEDTDSYVLISFDGDETICTFKEG